VFLLPALSAVASLTVLGIAYFHGRTHPESRVLTILSLYSGVVLFGHTILFTQCTRESALLVNQLVYLVFIFIPVLVYQLSTAYAKQSTPAYVYVGYGTALIFSVLLWSPSFVTGVEVFEYGCYAQAGGLHHVFTLYALTFIALAIYKVFSKLVRDRATSHARALKLHGVVLLAVLILTGLALLPAYGIPVFLELYAVTPLLSALLVLAVFHTNRFRLRIIAIQTFVVYVAVASFVQIFLVDSAPLRVTSTIVSTFVVMFGVLVTHNTMVELQMREKGERLAKYLANANTRLRDLDKQKTEFVSIASHQLRGPIATIIGYTSLIQDGSYGPVNEKLNEPLSRIFESGRRISIMVDDFLNVTRIEQGLMLYRKVECDINEVMRTAVEELRPIAEKRGLSIVYTPFTHAKVMMHADKTKLALVFQNLLDNAIKFTPSGSISVSLQESDTHDRLFVTFSDTGVGISHEDIGNLFTKFNRASNANTASVYGAGLGLYIAREIIKAHDGWIHVSSGGLGHGATLTIELPVRTVSGSTSSQHQPAHTDLL
jgi:signal transduction histidine kinase